MQCENKYGYIPIYLSARARYFTSIEPDVSIVNVQLDEVASDPGDEVTDDFMRHTCLVLFVVVVADSCVFTGCAFPPRLDFLLFFLSP